ncbi:hypothetical protein Dimus_026512 [Dionaea muscipula]
MFEKSPSRQSHSSVKPSSGGGGGGAASPLRVMKKLIGSPFIPPNDKGPVSRSTKEGGAAPPPNKGPSDTDLMKERFAKLLLGEDMSGGGKGVPSALALSNAITNLAARTAMADHLPLLITSRQPTSHRPTSPVDDASTDRPLLLMEKEAEQSSQEVEQQSPITKQPHPSPMTKPVDAPTIDDGHHRHRRTESTTVVHRVHHLLSHRLHP